MSNKSYKHWLHALYLAPMLLTACGSDSGTSDTTASTSSATTSSSSVSGIIVDPFIAGAIMCEDKDKNGTCDTGEQESSASDATGNFTFSKSLTPGSKIIIKTQGKHEGVTYDLDIAGTVDASGNIAVVSPLTTLETRGLTSAQIAAVLNAAAKAKAIKLSDGTTSWSITDKQILGNPMANSIADTKVSALTESDLSTLQASLASYALLKIMKGSTSLTALTSVDLYTSATTGEVSRIAQNVLSSITSTLTKTMLTNIKTNVDTGRTTLASGLVASTLYTTATASTKANSAIPEPTMSLPIKVAVSIIDRLSTVGFDTCNATTGTDTQKVNAALTAVGNTSTTITALSTKLGDQLYGLTYKSKLSQLEDIGGGTSVINKLPANMQTGYNDAKAGKTTYRFNTSNVISAL